MGKKTKLCGNLCYALGMAELVGVGCPPVSHTGRMSNIW